MHPDALARQSRGPLETECVAKVKRNELAHHTDVNTRLSIGYGRFSRAHHADIELASGYLSRCLLLASTSALVVFMMVTSPAIPMGKRNRSSKSRTIELTNSKSFSQEGDRRRTRSFWRRRSPRTPRVWKRSRWRRSQ